VNQPRRAIWDSSSRAMMLQTGLRRRAGEIQVHEEQIAYALRQVESGTTPPADVCRQLGCQRSDLLHLEEEIRPPARQRAAQAAVARGRKRGFETRRRRPHAGQAHARGGVEKRSLKITDLPKVCVRVARSIWSAQPASRRRTRNDRRPTSRARRVGCRSR
jgi:hypothetical protein